MKKRKKETYQSIIFSFPKFCLREVKQGDLRNLDHLMPVRFNPKTNIPNTLFIKSARCSTWANLDTSKWSLYVLSNSQEFNIIKGKKPLLEVIIVKIKYIVKKYILLKKIYQIPHFQTFKGCFCIALRQCYL